MNNKLELYYKIKCSRNNIIAPVDIMGCYSIPQIVQDDEKKLYVLISLMISSQTKDEINFQSMLNLITSKHKYINCSNQIRYSNSFKDFTNYLEIEINGKKFVVEKKEDFRNVINLFVSNYLFSLKTLLEMTLEEINMCISKVGFHNNKSKMIKSLCEHLLQNGYPKTLDECKKIKSIGLKMGLLYLNRFHKVQGISVDTHVHRICNRIGLVNTSKPEQTSKELEQIFDYNEFGLVNSVLVGFGQIICTAVKPKCERCPVMNECKFRNNW